MLRIPPDPPEREIERLSQRLGLSSVLARLLWHRGHRNPDEARRWLRPNIQDLEDPFQFVQMETAVARIRDALYQRERILIHGDYDVDGLSGTVLLLSFFRMLGADVSYHIPTRQQGYSFTNASIECIRKGGYKLCISVDNGTAAIEPIARINALGCDVIVTDHHATGPEVAPALAVLNPRLHDSGYPFADLAGVGVAFKLAWAVAQSFSRKRLLSDEMREFLLDSAGLVALGSVADVMPLRGENRVLVRKGLDALIDTKNPGLRALVDMVGQKARIMHAADIAFRIGPRLNAAGRMGTATDAIELMTARSYGEAQALARKLEKLNKARQQAEQQLVQAAYEQIDAHPGRETDPILLVGGHSWHLGVLGIVASRLAEHYGRPALVLSIQDGRARGSGRSWAGFDLKAALDRLEVDGLRYGGHAVAVGLEIAADRLDELRADLRAKLAGTQIHHHDGLQVDTRAPLSHWSSSELRHLAEFRPFGAGNPAPRFLAEGARIAGAIRRIGPTARGLRFTAIQNRVAIPALAPHLGGMIETLLARKAPWDLVYAPRFASHCENGPLELVVHGIELAEAGSTRQATGAE